MISRSAVALGAACMALVAVVPADAGDHAVRRLYRLPPVSGTIALPQESFGGGGGRRSQHDEERHSHGFAANRGGSSGRFSESQTSGTPQIIRGGYGFAAQPDGERWDSGGGLISAIADGGNAFAGAGTAWGTADSAPTGAGYHRYGGDSVRVAYGEPDLWTRPVYGAPPRLGYYAPGAPSTMSYYSAGSSAGPNGSPGGMAVYSAGAYGPGPEVIIIGHNARTRAFRQECTCGPHIISLRHPARFDAQR